MPAPATTDDFLTLVAKSELLPAGPLEEFVGRRTSDGTMPSDPLKLAQYLVFDGLLTKYQAEQLLVGRWRNFTIGGKYKLLERLGKGGMALVFLCEHRVMKRLVALKILPTAHGEDRELLGRFHREARALSQLRHPNIVGAYDVDHANKVHFLVMEYIDGGDLDQIVAKVGPLPWERAAHYIRQAAHGLQHAHECGLVHRDIKPGNLLVDRSGTVKLLDLGLARIFHESTDDLTTGRDARTLLGTVDYLAPEQALNSHDVDIRADIYGLGATFYFLLTGKGLFEDGTVAQKLSWHLHRPPTSLAEARPDVPAGLVAVIERMLAKKPEDRYQDPHEVYEALESWTRTPIEPPSPEELPQLSRAARRIGQASTVRMRVPSPRPNPATPPTISGPASTIAPAASPKATDPPSVATKILPAYNPQEDPAPAPARPVDDRKAAPGPNPPAASKPRPGPDRTIPAAPSPSPSPTLAPSPPARPRLGRRSTLAVVAAALLLLVAGAGIYYLSGPGGESPTIVPNSSTGRSSTGSPTGPGRSSSAPGPFLSQAPPADRPADATVSVTSGPEPARAFSTLGEAIRSARPGDRVEVRGTLLVEAASAVATEGAPRDLTIRGVNPDGAGRPVRWRGPSDLIDGRPLLDVSGLEGLRVEGFLFDGQGRAAELVRLSGEGAGSTLVDVQFEGATRAGLVLRGWRGESSRPATLSRARFATDGDSEAAIRIEAPPGRPPGATAAEFVRVASCRFLGPFGADLLVAGPVDELAVENCRFFRATDAVRYARRVDRPSIGLRLANNTFADLRSGLRFETTPPVGSSKVVVANNLFLNTPKIATLDNVATQPDRPAPVWVWTDEGKKTPVVAPGPRQFRSEFQVDALPEKVRLDIGCDESFAVWLNGAEVSRGPLPHFTQRVYAVDVTARLRKGRNVLAVEGTNRDDRIDARFGTTAGLLAQVVAVKGGRETVLTKTDGSWKGHQQAPADWNQPDFDDRNWPTVRPWPVDGTAWPWQFAVWDSTVRGQLKPPLEPIAIQAEGNVRDYKSWEGYPTTDAERVAVQDKDSPTLRDPRDPSFLRYAPLDSAGPGGSPVGATGSD